MTTILDTPLTQRINADVGDRLYLQRLPERQREMNALLVKHLRGVRERLETVAGQRLAQRVGQARELTGAEQRTLTARLRGTRALGRGLDRAVRLLQRDVVALLRRQAEETYDEAMDLMAEALNRATPRGVVFRAKSTRGERRAAQAVLVRGMRIARHVALRFTGLSARIRAVLVRNLAQQASVTAALAETRLEVGGIFNRLARDLRTLVSEVMVAADVLAQHQVGAMRVRQG